MLPPVDPAVFQRNPNFETLYNDLCTRKLTSNGATRDTKRQRVHDEIHRSLITAREAFLSSQILVNTLADLPSKAMDLPRELHTIIETTTAQLQGHVPSSDRAILANDIEAFLANLPAISTALSPHLTATASSLCNIANPAAPPPVASLPSTASALLHTATHTLPQDLHAAHLTLAHTLSTLLAAHHAHLTTSLRILEQTQHGALARASASTALHLAARATLAARSAAHRARSTPPPAPLLAALAAFRAHQDAADKALRDRAALARQGRALYERAGERGMRDLARRKEVLEREIARMEDEVGRLEGRRGG
ncbi:hypothetical protein ACN47E_007718 [Coniothyrium glycines]